MQLIASTYEIREELGSGGIGTVYLGWHTRLDKPVVLKAEQRTLKTDIRELRREVNMLKNLSHTYIPQVYDFITEENMVYTVMDYIEGESLDTLLYGGNWGFSQAEIIRWACQLLEALCYLHSQPPYGILHGDIKPANIMLTPKGDIRLIDFNIALALGEEGAVQVGHSRGYASPEHYGIDYSTRRSRVTQPVNGVHSTTNGKDKILLDVRSDIYCLGATLYHLLTGTPPEEDAKHVTPIQSPNVSPAVSAIVQKAMMPNPDERYQTAQEMLDAFEDLYSKDPRVRRHRKCVCMSAAVLTAVFLMGGLAAFTGLRQRERIQAAVAEQERAEKQAVEAIAQSENALRRGDRPEAIRAAKEALAAAPGQISYTKQAQKALTDALGVYELSDGFRDHLCLELPGEPSKLVMSPGGTRVGVMADGRALVFDTESGEELAALAAEPSALAELVFNGEDVLIYAGSGALRSYDLAQKRELWSGQAATAVTLSADGSTVAAIYKDGGFAVIYDAANGKIRQTVDFAGQRQRILANDVYIDGEYNLFALNGNGTRLAVSFDNGSLLVYDLQDSRENLTVFDKSEFSSFRGGFHGKYLAMVAQDDTAGQNVFAVLDMDQKAQTGAFKTGTGLYPLVDESGIYLASGRLVAKMAPETLDETEFIYADVPIVRYQISGDECIAAMENGNFGIYKVGNICKGQWTPNNAGQLIGLAGGYAAEASPDAPELRILKRVDRQDAQLLTYDRDCEHREARLSADGSTVMLFRVDSFRLYDAAGNVLADVDIPVGQDGRPPYDQQYRRDKSGDRLEVIYYDGQVRSYSAEDGRLLAETRREAPDKSLEEEFLTSRYRIVRGPLGTPEVFDLASGELVGQLQSEDTLIYVTETGPYLVAEFWADSSQERYGLLLDQDLEALARLPNLCDVLEDGTLLFDDMAGNIRYSPIYSLEELMTMSID